MDTGLAPSATRENDAASPDRMSGAEVLLRVLRDHDVEVVFGYPGGAVLPIYDAIFKQNAIRHVLVRHEQGAVHAAEGYARSTGKTGVVLVTSGPGATNAVTGLLDALMDSIPLVCLTGQVPTHLIGNDAFQEADTTGITRPATKHNYLVRRGEDLARVVHEAFAIAGSGRPGPVVVDLPKNVMIAEAPYHAASTAPHRSYRPAGTPYAGAIAAAVTLLRGAKRPIFYTGGGVINSGPAASEALRRLVDATGFPCTSTLMGLGALPASHPGFLGMLGMHGTVEANLAMHGCDVMVCVGARFDDRVTGRIDAFSPGSQKIHIDIDPSSINKNVRVDLPVIGDAGAALEQMLAGWNASPEPTDRAARAQMPGLRAGRRSQRGDQAATCDRASRCALPGVGPRDLRHHRSGPAPDVGRPAFPLRGAQSLDDLGRPRHDGLRPARRGRHADRASGRTRGRHLGRGERADEHPGTRHRRAVSPTSQSVHPEQPLHGHGAAVAGAAARIALFRKLQRGAAGFRDAR